MITRTIVHGLVAAAAIAGAGLAWAEMANPPAPGSSETAAVLSPAGTGYAAVPAPGASGTAAATRAQTAGPSAPSWQAPTPGGAMMGPGAPGDTGYRSAHGGWSGGTARFDDDDDDRYGRAWHDDDDDDDDDDDRRGRWAGFGSGYGGRDHD